MRRKISEQYMLKSREVVGWMSGVQKRAYNA